MTQETAQGTWYWFFLPVADVAEPLIAASPESVLRHFLRSWVGNPGAIEEAAVRGVSAHVPHARDDSRQ